MYRHEMLPFNYQFLDELDEATQYENTEFIEDFGLFKKGEKCDLLVLQTRDWELRQVNFEGNILKAQHFLLVPYDFPNSNLTVEEALKLLEKR